MVISTPPATAPPVAQLPASVVAASNPAPHGWTSYTVRDGDTLIGIAARFRTTAGVLAAKNEIRDRGHILAGATLSVPRTSAAKAGGGRASRVHVVRSGDTLIGIAARYRVPLTSLLKANHLRVGAFIHPGQKVVVRGAASSATAARSAAKGTAYTVRAGDTLGAIAIRHRTSVGAIAKASGISTRSLLHPGQRLTVPGRSGKATTKATVPDTFNGVKYPRAVAEAAARNRAILAAAFGAEPQRDQGDDRQDRPQARRRPQARPGDRLPGVGLEPACGLRGQRRGRDAGHPAHRRLGLRAGRTPTGPARPARQHHRRRRHAAGARGAPRTAPRRPSRRYYQGLALRAAARACTPTPSCTSPTSWPCASRS